MMPDAVSLSSGSEKPMLVAVDEAADVLARRVRAATELPVCVGYRHRAAVTALHQRPPPNFHENRIAVRFQYESRDESGQWHRSYGNELWEFSESGLMARREASINDVRIDESERRHFGPRPASEHGQDFPLW